MSWRVIVISKRAKLDLQLGYMVVRSEEVTKIVLSEISTILIESTAVSITTSLLSELSKRKIKVIFCDEKRNPSSELVSYYGSHDTSNIAAIVSAIGQHDEKTGTAVDAVSAALILADKTDVRRNRVRNPIKETFDIHDRVNYAAVASSLQVNVEKKVILLEIELDEEICSILDYFEIFLQRMLMCKRAAEILGLKFKMKANGNKIC